MTRIHSENVDDYSTRQVRVFLDGSEMNTNLISEVKDGDDGYIVLMVTTKEGDVMPDPRFDNVRQMVVSGRVDITFDGCDLSREQQSACAALFHRRALKVA